MITRTPAQAKFRPAPAPTPLDFSTNIGTAEAANEWINLAVALTAPEFELTTEEFPIVLYHFKRAQQRGARFDPCFIALMLLLERQMKDTDADADSDFSDQWLEAEDERLDFDESNDDRGTDHHGEADAERADNHFESDEISQDLALVTGDRQQQARREGRSTAAGASRGTIDSATGSIKFNWQNGKRQNELRND